ncbi:hypothetical protein MBH78_19495 [Oceanimonas sp. NS1]|nr:hypothetical protein [Oceanimonas sp. NS1]
MGYFLRGAGGGTDGDVGLAGCIIAAAQYGGQGKQGGGQYCLFHEFNILISRNVSIASSGLMAGVLRPCCGLESARRFHYFHIEIKRKIVVVSFHFFVFLWFFMSAFFLFMKVVTGRA